MKISIRWKIILSIGVPFLMIYLAVLRIDYLKLKEAAYRQTGIYLQEVASYHAERINGEFSTLAQLARATAAYLEVNPNISEEKLYDLLESNVKQNPRVYGSCVAFEPYSFDPKKKLFAPYVWRGKDEKASGASLLQRMDVGRDAYDYLDWEWYTNAKKAAHSIWTEPFYDKGAGDIIMSTHTAPFYKDGRYWGVSNIDVNLAKIQDWGKDSELGSLRFAILSHKGVFISHPNPNFIMKESIFGIARKYNRPDVAKAARKIIRGKKGLIKLKDIPFPGTNFIVHAPIRSTRWTFAVVMPEAKVMAPVWAQLRQFSLFMMASMGILLGVLLIVSHQITRPIRKLSREFQQVALGNLDVESTGKYPSDEIGDLAEMFHRMVFAIKNYMTALTHETSMREAVESELRIARSIQRSLLPHQFPPFPERKEFDLHAVNVPAHHVAGDFYDYFFISEDELVLVIADVSGKGVPAAMFMAVTRTLIRNLAVRQTTPDQMLKEINQTLIGQNENNLFVTMMLVFYNVKNGKLRFANAGHPHSYKIGGDKNVKPFGESTGMIVGVFPEAVYESRQEELAEGEAIIFYTDGVSEARNSEGDFWGTGRLETTLSENLDAKPREICHHLLKLSHDFQGAEIADDITIMVLRRNSLVENLSILKHTVGII